MRNERFAGQPRFEALESAQTVDEALLAYGQLTDSLVHEHKAGLAQIADEHEEAFKTEAATPGAHDVDQLLRTTEACVQEQLQPAESQLTNVLSAVANTMSSMLSGRDAEAFRSARTKASAWGVDSVEVMNALNAASSAEAKAAMRAALDTEVFRSVRAKASAWGVTSIEVSAVLNAASSTKASAAMKAALDDAVFRSARTKASAWGVDSVEVMNALNAASSAEAKAAMKAALDDAVFRSAKTKASAWGVDSNEVTTVLNAASSASVRQVIARLVQGKAASSQSSRSRGYDQNQSTGYERTTGYGDFSFSADDFLRDMSSRKGFFGRRANGRDYQNTGSERRTSGAGQREQQRGQQQNRARQEPRREAPRQQPERDVEVEQVIATVIARDKGNKWLSTEEPINVRRVINSVRRVRAKATERGETLSDRDIYLHYRKAADKGEIDGRDIADQTIVQSFKIINAMMGGNHRGRLPF